MNKLFIIKIGGNVLDNPSALSSFLKDFASIKEPKILIHGGGKIATKIGDKLGIESKYINGRRITDAETLDVVTQVYGGLVNKQIVATLQQLDCNAIGVTGADGNLIKATKRPVKDIDYGYLARKLKDFSGADLQATVDAAVEAKLQEALKQGLPSPLATKELQEAAKRVKPSTKDWFATARNYALYANQSGLYDDILSYLNVK